MLWQVERKRAPSRTANHDRERHDESGGPGAVQCSAFLSIACVTKPTLPAFSRSTVAARLFSVTQWRSQANSVFFKNVLGFWASLRGLLSCWLLGFQVFLLSVNTIWLPGFFTFPFRLPGVSAAFSWLFTYHRLANFLPASYTAPAYHVCQRRVSSAQTHLNHLKCPEQDQ